MIVIAKIQIQSGKEDTAKQALSDMVEKVKDESGTLVYSVNQLVSDPTTFVIYEKYKDKEAYEQHSKTPHLKKLFETVTPLLAGAPEIQPYSEIATL